MNYRSAYIRRARKAFRLKKRAAAVTLAVVAAGAGFVLWEGEPALERLAQAGAEVAEQAGLSPTLQIATTVDSNGTRRIFPYSVVPGGVASRSELTRIIQTDKVVAAHYAAFKVDQAHPVTVAKARYAHVSYRKGDQVYWTAKKVKLAEGEILLSDGQNEIRGRCGNRISDTAMLPVEAAAPGEDELDASADVEPDGRLSVAAPFGSDGAGRGSHQLLSFPNGAGLLAVSGGEGWRAPGSPFGASAGTPYPSSYYGNPVVLGGKASAQTGTGTTGSDATTAPVATAPANTAADTVAATTPATGEGSTAGSTTDAGKPVQTASGGGSTTETAHGGSVADAAPLPTGAGSVADTTPLPTAGTTPADTVELPTQLTDTVQPEPDPLADVKAPTIPDTLLWPEELPTVPTKTAEATAEAPEPASLWLAGVGIAAMLLLRRRPRRLA